MKHEAVFENFIDTASMDHRIGIAHVGLYATLFRKWIQQGYQDPIICFGHEIMNDSKINGCATYHKLIRELAEFDYIRYEPSFYRKRGSKIFLDMSI